MSGPVPTLLLVIITLLLPPLGVLLLVGCGADLLVNICLTILGYFPGHIHAFYLIFVYYDRRSQSRKGTLTGRRAPGIFSDVIQNGGTAGYRTTDGTQTGLPTSGISNDASSNERMPGYRTEDVSRAAYPGSEKVAQ